ncbi:sorting nexin-6 isoform X2 [Amia ocellicauda]|uniref:sorting nexin-6 isoform X2 n=1 Tax=Amia ocellicauda TaxID=2972642 RepID=UPI003464CC26
MMEEADEVFPPLKCSDYKIAVSDSVSDGDSFVYVVKSQELSSNTEYQVERTFEDFEGLQHCLFNQEGVPGLQGIIFPPLPAKPCPSLSNSDSKSIKVLGLLAVGENWPTYCQALENYLCLITGHSILSKNPVLQRFLTQNEPLAIQRVKKGIFNWLSQAVEGLRKENHKDIDDIFQNERDNNLTLTGLTKAVTEKFTEMVLTEQRLAVACGHFSTSLQLGISQQEDQTAQEFSKMCLKLSEVIDAVQKNYESVAENNINTIGLYLELYSRYLEAEKEMLFRRTCKLVEVENANKNLEKAKAIKKATMEEMKKATDKEFKEISGMAKIEIQNFHRERVRAFQQSLMGLCVSQLNTARESCAVFTQQLSHFRELCGE